MSGTWYPAHSVCRHFGTRSVPDTMCRHFGTRSVPDTMCHCSRLASKLHLGVISAKLVPERPAIMDTTIIFLFAVSVFFFVGVSAWVVSRVAPSLPHGPSATLGFGTVVGIAMVAGFFATILSTIVAYLAAVATYRFGLDPDNHGIPIVTSSMDFLGAVTLVATIVLFGVTAHG